MTGAAKALVGAQFVLGCAVAAFAASGLAAVGKARGDSPCVILLAAYVPYAGRVHPREWRPEWWGGLAVGGAG